MAYRRESYTGHGSESEEKAAIVVVLNFKPQEAKWNLVDGKFSDKSAADPQVLFGNYNERLNINDGVLTLRPFEAVVFSGDGIHDPGRRCSVC